MVTWPERRWRAAKPFTKAKITFRVSLIAFVAVIACSIFIQLPTTVMGGSNNDVRKAWSTLYPQGWQFFTKAPDDAEATVYSVQDGSIDSISEFPNSLTSNLWGFARGQRAQGTELASVTQQSTNWVECGTVDGDCLVETARLAAPEKVKNPSDLPTICGTVIVAMTVPVPWEFRSQFDGWRVDDRAVLLEVEC